MSPLSAARVLSVLDLRGTPLEGAQCRFDAELHTGPDHVEHEDPAERAAREAVAIEVCSSCPLRAACLDYATRTLPGYGVWGGFTAAEIAELAALPAAA